MSSFKRTHQNGDGNVGDRQRDHEHILDVVQWTVVEDGPDDHQVADDGEEGDGAEDDGHEDASVQAERERGVEVVEERRVIAADAAVLKQQ